MMTDVQTAEPTPTAEPAPPIGTREQREAVWLAWSGADSTAAALHDERRWIDGEQPEGAAFERMNRLAALVLERESHEASAIADLREALRLVKEERDKWFQAHVNGDELKRKLDAATKCATGYRVELDKLRTIHEGAVRHRTELADANSGLRIRAEAAEKRVAVLERELAEHRECVALARCESNPPYEPIMSFEEWLGEMAEQGPDELLGNWPRQAKMALEEMAKCLEYERAGNADQHARIGELEREVSALERTIESGGAIEVALRESLNDLARERNAWKARHADSERAALESIALRKERDALKAELDAVRDYLKRVACDRDVARGRVSQLERELAEARESLTARDARPQPASDGWTIVDAARLRNTILDAGVIDFDRTSNEDMLGWLREAFGGSGKPHPSDDRSERMRVVREPGTGELLLAESPKPGDVLSGEDAKAWMLANPGRKLGMFTSPSCRYMAYGQTILCQEIGDGWTRYNNFDDSDEYKNHRYVILPPDPDQTAAEEATKPLDKRAQALSKFGEIAAAAGEEPAGMMASGVCMFCGPGFIGHCPHGPVVVSKPAAPEVSPLDAVVRRVAKLEESIGDSIDLPGSILMHSRLIKALEAVAHAAFEFADTDGGLDAERKWKAALAKLAGEG